MRYNASISDFFKCPKWGMNLLFGALCMFIPVIGPLVLGGWLVCCFWTRGDDEDPANMPPFDFQHFSRYLELGLWPFVVNLVASLVLFPLVAIIMVPMMVLPGLLGHRHGTGQEIMVGLICAGCILLQFIVSFAYQFVATPLMLRATITQDFKSSFDFRFVKDFVSRVWKEQLLIIAFMLGVSLCMVAIGIITCFIGFYFTLGPIMFCWYHLQKQLYQVYLSRGGTPVPMSPKLRTTPPPLAA